MKRTITQATLFLIAAAALGLAGNAIHPDGLELGRDYFPVDRLDEAAGQSDGAENGDEVPDPRRDFQMMDRATAHDWWQASWDTEAGAWNAANGIFFLDARRPDSYATGHIPGAFLADPYGDEKIISEELAAKLREEAFAVIIYCNGGDCEDSLTVAFQLKYGHQVPEELIHVYEGGWTDWRGAGLPEEK